MLCELTITNFAIVDKLHVTLAAGFNVLTGETGAGKSIIVDSVDALLGGKYGAEFVRSGAEGARVEGVFLLPDQVQGPALQSVLAENGLEAEEGALILSREIHRSGRTTARINGRAVPTSILQQVGQTLVDIHGQTEHLSLLRTGEHINVLDRYAGVQEQRATLAGLVSELRAVRREQQALMADERELARRMDLLRFQLDEMDAANLHVGEEDGLLHERNLLANAERLAALTEAIYTVLYDGSDEQSAIIDLLGQVSQQMAELAKLDAGLAPQEALASTVSEELAELARAVRDYRDRIEFNPERLEEVEERLALIHNLKRKYGPTIEDVLAFGAKAARELDGITHSEERLQELREREQALLVQAGALAGEISRLRRQAGADLATRVEEELAELNMRHVRFQVATSHSPAADGVLVPNAQEVAPDLDPATRYGIDATGIDRIEFLISPNPGEPLKSLTKVASGGETARVMLALKSILSAADDVPTLIFDEIDVGIGGRSGYVVGEKLWNLGPRHQVLCVTHLPQVAAYGDAHYTVEKQVQGGQTQTAVRQLDAEERVREVAAMLGSSSDLSRENAREILQRAKQWKGARVAAPDLSSPSGSGSG